jgi:hypothetical protein
MSTVLYNWRPAIEVMYSQKDSKKSAAKHCTALIEDASSSYLLLLLIPPLPPPLDSFVNN